MAIKDKLYPPIRTNRCRRNPSKYIPKASASIANNKDVMLNVPSVANESKSIVK